MSENDRREAAKCQPRGGIGDLPRRVAKRRDAREAQRRHGGRIIACLRGSVSTPPP